MGSFQRWHLDWLTGTMIFMTGNLSHMVPSSLVTRVKYKTDKNEVRLGEFKISQRKCFYIFTVKIAADLACSQRWYPCNTSGFRRQCYSSLQRTHLPIYANLLWFSVSFAKLRRSGPVWNFLSLPPPLRRHVHLSPICLKTLCLCKISLPIT